MEVSPKPENKVAKVPSNLDENICFVALPENIIESSSFPFMWNAEIADHIFVKCFLDSWCQSSLLKEDKFQKFSDSVLRRLFLLFEP